MAAKAKRDQLVKIHLILRGYAICSTPRREGGYQAVTSPREFRAIHDDARCLKCAVALQKMEGARR